MSDEDTFQAALDANPDDWTTRLVFADWLEEQCDPRAEGIRAIGRLQVRPDRWAHQGNPDATFFWSDRMVHAPSISAIPDDWWLLVRPECRYHNDYRTHKFLRKETEDWAALAFLGLPPARRAELLSSSLTALA